MPVIQISINELLEKAGNLPPMPMVAQKAMEIIRNPKSNMGDLANVIKLDQGMTSLILRWVNSGYYSLRHQIVSIEQAVAYLGQRTVQNLVLTASISRFMNRSIPGYGLERGELWKHSIGMAAGARLLTQEVMPSRAEDAYYAGLLSDVGKLAFDVLLRTYPVDVTSLGSKPFDQIEIELFGYDHPTVGSAMVKRWNLPSYLNDIILNHHTPDKLDGEIRLLGYAVHASDAIMSMFGIGIGTDALQYNLDPKAVEALKLTESSLEKVYERVLPVISEAEEYLQK